MSQAIPVVLGYIILISGLNLNLHNLSMRCTCSSTKLTNRLDKWAQKQIDRLIELIKKQLYQRETESIIYSNNYRQLGEHRKLISNYQNNEETKEG